MTSAEYRESLEAMKPDIEKLRQGKCEMAARCKKATEAIAAEAGVKHICYDIPGNRLRGYAYPGEYNVIHVPEPTTRRRLHIFAHECAHCALKHDQSKEAKHKQEYEAERWAFEAMRRHGIAVPKKALRNAKEHVAWAIDKAIRRGAKNINKEARHWAKVKK